MSHNHSEEINKSLKNVMAVLEVAMAAAKAAAAEAKNASEYEKSCTASSKTAKLKAEEAKAAMDACNEIMEEVRKMQTRYFTSIEEFREELKKLQEKIDAQNNPSTSDIIVGMIVNYGLTSLALKALDYAGTFVGAPGVGTGGKVVFETAKIGVNVVKKIAPLRFLFGA